jgi:ketosteroid isomerase-like protein
MKTAILLIIATTVLACQPQSPVAGGAGGVIQGMYDAFANGDGEAVLAAMDSQIVWNEAENFPYADNNPYVGPQNVAEGVFARLGSDWEYWHLTIEHMVESGDEVIAFGRYSAKNKQTGKVINAQFVHQWMVREGKAVSFQQYADTAQVLAAME